MISTHVLDTARGCPAAGVPVIVERLNGVEGLAHLATAVTDADGRVRELLPAGTPLEAGTYQLTFETAAYFAALHVNAFYPRVSILFTVSEAGGHYHVPLLLSPFGYSTYRGS